MVACFTGSPPSPRGLQARQVLEHQPAVGVVVELLLDQLRGRGDRQVHRFLAQREDRFLLFGLDLAARAVEQLLLLFPRLGEQRLALLRRHHLRLGEDLLGFGARLLQRPALLLEGAGRLGARFLCFVELVLDASLALLDRPEERRPAELPQQGQQHQEDDQRPQDQPRVDGEGREPPFPTTLLDGGRQRRQDHLMSLNSSANTSAASATPSISAAVRIIAPRISPEACGCRAIASTACPPMRPMPSPAPITARPSPKPAPSRALVFLATAAASAAPCTAPCASIRMSTMSFPSESWECRAPCRLVVHSASRRPQPATTFS